MADPDKDRADRERLNSRLGMIAFILMALVGLLSILFMRPTPAHDLVVPEITRSN